MKDYRQKGIENNPTSPTPCTQPFKMNNRGLFQVITTMFC